VIAIPAASVVKPSAFIAFPQGLIRVT